MEPILHKFRNVAFGGFNRRDVLEYIELSARESNAKIEELRAHLEAARKEKAELSADSATVQVSDLGNSFKLSGPTFSYHILS